MSESQGAPQAPAATQAPQDPKAAQPQGAGAPGTTGNQTGTSAVSEAAKEAMRKLRIKNDDGTEAEVDEDEVVRTYKERKKHQAVASRELNEGRQIKKQAETFISMMKDEAKFFEAAEKMGHNPRALAEKFLAEKIRYEMMDPRERELLEKTQKLTEYEKKEAEAREAKEKEQLAKLTKHYTEKFNTEIVEALKDTPIPQSKDSVARIADYLGKAAKARIPMTAKEAAILVQQDLKSIKASVYKDATAEQLIEMLGEEGLQKLRAYDVARLKDPMAKITTPEHQITEQRPRDRATGRYTRQQWANVKRGLPPGPK